MIYMSLVSFEGFIYMYTLFIYLWLCVMVTVLPCGLGILTVVSSLTFSLAYFSAKLTQDIAVATSFM